MKKKTINKRKIAYDAMDLDLAMAEFALPRLQWLERNTNSHPIHLTHDEWIQILKDIQLGFVECINYHTGLDMTKTMEERKAIIKKSFGLLSEYYMDLWD